MGNNAQLTLLLTLKDRAAYTKRWLSFAKEFHCPFPILIADGSKTSENADIIKGYLSHSDLDIQYHRYPFDENFDVYYKKVADAVSKVTTPFIVKADNDDFYDFSVLLEGLDLLEKDSTYNSCHVRRLDFYIKSPLNIHGHFKSKKIEIKQSARERLLLYFADIAPGVFNNIHRTFFYRDFWQDVIRFKFQHILSHEILLDASCFASGNIATTSSVGYFREGSGQGNTCQLDLNALKIVMNPQWTNEQKQISECVADILVERDGMKKDAAVNFYFDGLRNIWGKHIVADLLVDPMITDNNKRLISRSAIKYLISKTKFNNLMKKILEIKNRTKAREVAFSPIQSFLKKWYSENKTGLVLKE